MSFLGKKAYLNEYFNKIKIYFLKEGGEKLEEKKEKGSNEEKEKLKENEIEIEKEKEIDQEEQQKEEEEYIPTCDFCEKKECICKQQGKNFFFNLLYIFFI